MQTELTATAKQLLSTALERKGLKATRQRAHIFAVVKACRTHPTASQVYRRAKQEMPHLSLATVYNSLETLANCGLVRSVQLDRGPTHYCPNLSKHAHFHCKRTGQLYDIKLPEALLGELKALLPNDFQIDSLDIAFHGNSPSESAVNST